MNSKLFNGIRIRIQSNYSDSSKEYKILKKNWRILSSYYIDIEGENLYNHIQKKNTSAQQILIDAMNVHPDLDEAYSLTQDFLRGIREVKYENAKDWLNNWIVSTNNSRLSTL